MPYELHPCLPSFAHIVFIMDKRGLISPLSFVFVRRGHVRVFVPLHFAFTTAVYRGLGKTIQTIGFFQRLRHMQETRLRGPFLVVAPLSLVYQWQNEAAVWAPELNVVVYHGSQESRELIQEHEFWYRAPHVAADEAAALRKEHVVKFDLMVTTFEVAIKDMSLLSKVPWRVLVVDEAHRLKNPEARLFQQLQQLQRDHCVLLTGTPLQNKTEELWGLLHFASPEKFPRLDLFVQRFGDLKDSSQVAQLHGLLKPFLLRRVKEDVEKSLPPKEETIIEVSLTAVQKQFYRAIYEHNTESLFKDVKASSAPSLMNVMMELRKCCNHPYLNRGVEQLIVEQIPPQKQTRTNLHLQMVNSSGKMLLLDKLLPRLHEQGHKVLLFSQMVRVLDLLEDFVRHQGYLYERLDGGTRSGDRAQAVARFNRPSCKRFLMLLSTRAGGLGLNLTSADTVIIFDSDWNPHNDIQAQARAHRIGQTRAVMVYRLITARTYEMHMFHKASMKLGLDKAVLAHARNEKELEDQEALGGGARGRGGVGGGSGMELQAKEIDELLKRGAYNVFREDDAEVKAFVEADIDSILARSVKKITYGGGDQSAAAGGSNNGGSFSKASFVGTANDGDIDLDDPDFWKKAVGLNQPAGFVDDPSQISAAAAAAEEAAAAENSSSVKTSKRIKKGKEMAAAEGKDGEDNAAPVALTASEEAAKALVAAAAADMQEPEVKPPTPEPTEAEGGAGDGGAGGGAEGPEGGQSLSSGSGEGGGDTAGGGDTNNKVGSSSSSSGGSGGVMSASSRNRKPPGTGVGAAAGAAAAAAKSSSVGRLTRFKPPPKPPKDWGPHNRDRLIRALMLFGFGRWDRLRRESGAAARLLGDVENLSRAYVHVCGLAAAEAWATDGDDAAGSGATAAAGSDHKQRTGPGNSSSSGGGGSGGGGSGGAREGAGSKKRGRGPGQATSGSASGDKAVALKKVNISPAPALDPSVVGSGAGALTPAGTTASGLNNEGSGNGSSGGALLAPKPSPETALATGGLLPPFNLPAMWPQAADPTNTNTTTSGSAAHLLPSPTPSLSSVPLQLITSSPGGALPSSGGIGSSNSGSTITGNAFGSGSGVSAEPFLVHSIPTAAETAAAEVATAAEKAASEAAAKAEAEVQAAAAAAENDRVSLARARCCLTVALAREPSPWVRECMTTALALEEMKSMWGKNPREEIGSPPLGSTPAEALVSLSKLRAQSSSSSSTTTATTATSSATSSTMCSTSGSGANATASSASGSTSAITVAGASSSGGSGGSSSSSSSGSGGMSDGSSSSMEVEKWAPPLPATTPAPQPLMSAPSAELSLTTTTSGTVGSSAITAITPAAPSSSSSTSLLPSPPVALGPTLKVSRKCNGKQNRVQSCIVVHLFLLEHAASSLFNSIFFVAMISSPLVPLLPLLSIFPGARAAHFSGPEVSAQAARGGRP